ncbi:hypothetical protein SETIT_7G209500v2 [Setaria italica]|uniref:Uncharacterized protein n=1 Tax=Setaria italica TaxID=4555 RepID=A0A368RY40_SETIT|nr:hypothetical protein SETIT_7G209500v2 [Setaria italica]
MRRKGWAGIGATCSWVTRVERFVSSRGREVTSACIMLDLLCTCGFLIYAFQVKKAGTSVSAFASLVWNFFQVISPALS